LDVLSVIVPIRNDERGIRAACLEIAHAVRPLVWDGTIEDYEIVLVDDASTDDTGPSADVFAQRDRNVIVVHHDESQGFDAAVRTGAAAARGTLLAHGQAGVPLASAALRPVIDKLRAEGLRAVAVRPDPKLLARLAPGRTRSAVKVVQRDGTAHDEAVLPRNAVRLRLDQPTPLLSRNARTGTAVLAALSLVVALISFGVVSARNEPQAASGSLVGRHGHLAVISRQTSSPPTQRAIPGVVAGRVVVTPTIPKPPSAPSIVTVSASIDDTCATDVTSALQRRVDSAPDNSTISLDPNGCYLVGGGLSLVKRNNLTIDGRNAQLRSGTLACTDTQGLSLSNLSVQAKNDAPAMAVSNCSATSISNVTLAGDDTGLTISGASHDISVNGLKAQTDQAAVDLRGAERIALNAVNLTSTRAAALDLDPGKGGTVKDVEVRDSTLTSPVAAVASAGDGTVSDVYVHDDALLGGRTKIFVQGEAGNPSHVWRIYANRGDVTQSLGTYVDLSYVTDVLVANNLFPAHVIPLRAAVGFGPAQGDLAVIDNDFTGACHPYAASPQTAFVRSYGNKVSNC